LNDLDHKAIRGDGHSHEECGLAILRCIQRTTQWIANEREREQTVRFAQKYLKRAGRRGEVVDRVVRGKKQKKNSRYNRERPPEYRLSLDDQTGLQCLRKIDVPRRRLELRTTRLKAGCSTIELTGHAARLDGLEPPTLNFEG
jgi:hypothetical protein